METTSLVNSSGSKAENCPQQAGMEKNQSSAGFLAPLEKATGVFCSTAFSGNPVYKQSILSSP